MKIAVDLRPLQIGHQNRGIGAYMLNVLEAMPLDADHEYVFLRYNTSNPAEDYKIGHGRPYKEVILKKRSFSRHPVKLISYGLGLLLPVFSKVMRHRPDVFLQFDYLLGAPRSRRCKKVTIAHDLIPLRLKGMYLPSWKKYIGFRQIRLRGRVRLVVRSWFYERKYSNGMKLFRKSSVVISVSKNTTQDLITIAKVKEEKIKTIYSAASFRDDKSKVGDKISDLIRGMTNPYLVYIGGTDRRRQIDELVYAFNLYSGRQKPLSLILAGNEFTKDSTTISPIAKHAILSSSYTENIHMLGKISEAEKRYILEHAAAFIYPTLYEGFGLPIVEAMQAGCPVITYKNSSIPEIAGDAALFTENPDGYAIYQQLCVLIDNEKLAKELQARGVKQAEKFSWKNANKEIWQLIQE